MLKCSYEQKYALSKLTNLAELRKFRQKTKTQNKNILKYAVTRKICTIKSIPQFLNSSEM